MCDEYQPGTNQCSSVRKLPLFDVLETLVCHCEWLGHHAPNPYASLQISIGELFQRNLLVPVGKTELWSLALRANFHDFPLIQRGKGNMGLRSRRFPLFLCLFGIRFLVFFPDHGAY